MFISYIGHSGTEAWDNGITEVTDLQPAFSDRHSLISDFGCSTGKFAEPDDAFSELFISASGDGQAIAYSEIQAGDMFLHRLISPAIL